MMVPAALMTPVVKVTGKLGAVLKAVEVGGEGTVQWGATAAVKQVRAVEGATGQVDLAVVVAVEREAQEVEI